MPSTIPIVVRVERIFSSSACVWAITDCLGSGRQFQEDILERGALGDELVDRHAGREREITELFARHPVHQQRLFVHDRRLDPLVAATLLGALPRAGVRTRTEPPTRAVSCSSDDSMTSLPRLMIST